MMNKKEKGGRRVSVEDDLGVPTPDPAVTNLEETRALENGRRCGAQTEQSGRRDATN